MGKKKKNNNNNNLLNMHVLAKHSGDVAFRLNYVKTLKPPCKLGAKTFQMGPTLMR